MRDASASNAGGVVGGRMDGVLVLVVLVVVGGWMSEVVQVLCAAVWARALGVCMHHPVITHDVYMILIMLGFSLSS